MYIFHDADNSVVTPDMIKDLSVLEPDWNFSSFNISDNGFDKVIRYREYFYCKNKNKPRKPY
jgi:hypothetical protein